MDIKATKEDRLKFARSIVSTNNPEKLLKVIDKIWEDGYRCGEIETQLHDILDGRN